MANNPNLTLLEPISHETRNNPFSIHHIFITQGTDLVLYLHWHNEIEFFYIESGETIFCIEENEYHLQKGDAIFIPPNHLHMAKQVNNSPCEFYAIVFSPSLFADSYISPALQKYIQPILYNSFHCSLQITDVLPWQKEFLSILKHIFTLSVNSLDEADLEIRGYIMIIWQRLYNNHLSKIKIPQNYGRLSVQLSEVLDYIHTSYEKEITLSSLADLSHFCKEQFCRSFKQLTGLTPFNYLNRYRIIKSCEYLVNTSKKITDIAVLCGFNNISYFNRVFIRFIKMTPAAYRKLMR